MVFRFASVLLLVCALTPLLEKGPLLAKERSLDEPGESLAATVDALIAELGSAEYALREAAQHRLEKLGTAAFDALHEAQDNEDTEIRLRARYLIRSMKIAWAHDDDPLKVRQILGDYHGKSEANRKTLIQKVAAEDAVRPLCRIARFEPSDVLSKYASFYLIQKKFDSQESRSAQADVIRKEIQRSRRTAADWLRLYVRYVEDPDGCIDLWDQVVSDEIGLLTTGPEKTSRELAQSLARWHADELLDRDMRAEGLVAMRRVLDAHDDSSLVRLMQLADWLMHRKAWNLVVETSDRFTDLFEKEPLLLYRRAEAHLRSDQRKEADQVAARALKLPAKASLRGSAPFDTHLSRGYFLEERGLIAWCKREYQLAIDNAGPTDYAGYFSRFRLSELLHDEGDNQKAAETLESVLKVISENRTARLVVQGDLKRDPKTIEARMNFFKAKHLAKTGAGERSRKYLEEGYKSDPTDPDVLIAMYRSPDASDQWRRQTEERIAAAAGLIKSRIGTIESAPQDDNSTRMLANAHNHYAWLISNTKGDYQSALESSQKSLELIPDSPELTDTLARCYYALKDYKNAVEYQRQAAEKLPHSAQIRRQLELFEKAYEEAKRAPR